MPPKHTATKKESWKAHVDLRPSAPIEWFPSSGYTHIHDSLPNLNQFLKKQDSLGFYNLNTHSKIHKWEPDVDSTHNMGTLHIQYEGSTDILPMKAYCKIIPLMDPYLWIRDQRTLQKSQLDGFWMSTNEDVADKNNKGYVDVLCTYLCSQYAREQHSPHFLRYFGAFRAVAEKYSYSLKEEFEDYRFRTWFWERVRNGDITLQVKDKMTGEMLSMDEIYTTLKPDDEFLTEDESDSEGGDSETLSNITETSSLSSIEVETPYPGQPHTLDDLESIHSLEIEDSAPIKLTLPARAHNHSERLGNSEDGDTIESDISYSEVYEINALLPCMPVVLMFSQKADGELEKLYSIYDNAKDKEPVWTAWLWQIIVALYQAQKSFMFTHNDLHASNIVWCPTTLTHLYYTHNNIHYKVPTYGYIFQIIDFGRSIYTAQNVQCISLDFFPGFEAQGQYNFGPFYDEEYPKVHPNRNFDLCRLACSLIRIMYPENPEEKKNGKVLTKEDNVIVRETVSPLFNMLWEWTKTTDGDSVFEGPLGEEKYPGFELYSIIAEKCHNAAPESQLGRALFQVFQTKEAVTKSINV